MLEGKCPKAPGMGALHTCTAWGHSYVEDAAGNVQVVSTHDCRCCFCGLRLDGSDSNLGASE